MKALENWQLGSIAQDMPLVTREARFTVGDIVRHRLFTFRGVVFDVDPEFANTDEWWEAIPDTMKPDKDQPFYHLLAETDDNSYIAYVSQQNLERDDSDLPVDHPAIPQLFSDMANGRYMLKPVHRQ